MFKFSTLRYFYQNTLTTLNPNEISPFDQSPSASVRNAASLLALELVNSNWKT